MSPDDVDVIRSIYRAFNERRIDDIPWCHGDVEGIRWARSPTPTSTGAANKLSRLFGMFLDPFEDFRFDIDRLLDSGITSR